MTMNLEEFLILFPWDDSTKPIHCFWEFPTQVQVSELWPYIADTSSLNQRMKLTEFEYQEREGRLFGKARQAGFDLVWEEHPWEWIFQKQISNRRIYSKGFAYEIRTSFLFETGSNGNCLLKIYFGLLPRNFLFNIFLKMAIPNLKGRLENAILEIQKEIIFERNAFSTEKRKYFEPEPNLLNPEALDRLLIQLKNLGVASDLISQIRSLVEKVPDNQVERIKLKKLEEDWNQDLDSLLYAFLWGCRLGLFNLTWDTVCPHCRGVRSKIHNLGEIPPQDNCDVCQVNFFTSKLFAIEVTFHIHPALRSVQKQIYCASEPSKKSHILISKTAKPMEVIELPIPPLEKSYRLRKKSWDGFHLIHIKQEIVSTKWTWQNEPEELDLGIGTIVEFRNESEEPVQLFVEDREEDFYALRPAHLFNFPDFRDIFSKETIATHYQLDIGVQTILFTDVVGSSEFYEEAGDHFAFRTVSEHFSKAFLIIKQNKGAVVKTIGDSIMASFPNPVNALKSAHLLQESFKTGSVKLRITIHKGNCLAVNLNSQIDYFGGTVNYAAKMQSKAGAGEIVFSEAIFRDSLVRNYMKETQTKVKRLIFSYLGKRELPVYLWFP